LVSVYPLVHSLIVKVMLVSVTNLAEFKRAVRVYYLTALLKINTSNSRSLTDTTGHRLVNLFRLSFGKEASFVYFASLFTTDYNPVEGVNSWFQGTPWFKV
jgi:hypothetical protein